MRKILPVIFLFMLLLIPISQAKPYYSSERYGCFEVTWKGGIGAVSQHYKVTIRELCGYNRYIKPIFVIDKFYTRPNRIRVVLEYPKEVTEKINESVPVKYTKVFNYSRGDGVIFNPPILTKDDLVFYDNCWDNGDNQTFTCEMTNYTNETVLKTLKKYYRVRYKRVDYSHAILIYPDQRLYLSANGEVTIKLKVRYSHVVWHRRRWVTGRVGVILEGHLYHPWFNTSWSNRKLIVLDTSSNSRFIIRIPKYPEMQPNCSDVRVTALAYDLNEYDMPFTILSCTNDSVVIALWSKPHYEYDNVIPNAIYIYYGNDNPPPRELPTSNQFFGLKNPISVGIAPSVAAITEQGLYVARPNTYYYNRHLYLCKYYNGTSKCITSALYSRYYYALGIDKIIPYNSSAYVIGFYYNGWKWYGYVIKVNSTMGEVYEASVFPVTDTYPSDELWVYDGTIYNNTLVLAARWRFRNYAVTDDRSMLIFFNMSSGSVISTKVYNDPSQVDYFLRVFSVNGTLMAIRRIGNTPYLYLDRFNSSYDIVSEVKLPYGFIDYKKANDGNVYLYFKDGSIYKVNDNGTITLFKKINIPSTYDYAIDTVFIGNYPNAGAVFTTGPVCYYDYDVVWCSTNNGYRTPYFRQITYINATKGIVPYYLCMRPSSYSARCYEYASRQYYSEPIVYHDYDEFIVNNTWGINYSYAVLNAVLNKSLEDLSGLYVTTNDPRNYLPFYVWYNSTNKTILQIPIINLTAGSVQAIRVFFNSSNPYVPHYTRPQYVYPVYILAHPHNIFLGGPPARYPLLKGVTANVVLTTAINYQYYSANNIHTIHPFKAPFHVEMTMYQYSGNVTITGEHHNITVELLVPKWGYGTFRIFLDGNLTYSASNVYIDGEYGKLMIDLNENGNLTIKLGDRVTAPTKFDGRWIITYSTNVSKDWITNDSYSLSVPNLAVGYLAAYSYLPSDIVLYGGEYETQYVVDVENLNNPPSIQVYSPKPYQFYNYPILKFKVSDDLSQYLYVSITLDNSTVYYNDSYVNGTVMSIDLSKYNLNMSVNTPHIVRVTAYDGTSVSYSDDIPFYFAPFELYTSMKSDYIPSYDNQIINMSTTLVNTTNFIIESWYSDFYTTYPAQNTTITPNCTLPWCNATYEIPCTQNSFVYFNVYVTNGTNTYKAGPFSYICGGLPASVGVTTLTPTQTATGGLSPNTEVDVKSFAAIVPEGKCVNDTLVIELEHDWFTYNASLKVYDIPSNMIIYPQSVEIRPGSNLINIEVCGAQSGDYAGRLVVTLDNGLESSGQISIHVRSFSQGLMNVIKSKWVWVIIFIGLVLWYKSES